LYPRGPTVGIVFAALTACSASAGYPYAQEPDPRRTEYVVGVTDGLSIRVWRNTDLSLDTTVMPDGTITMPLLGRVSVANKTASEIQQSLTQALKAYLKEEGALVTVSVTRVSSYRISVSGYVNHPGVIESTRYLTVSEAILLAGGPTRFASANNTILLRTRPDGTVLRIPIQYADIEAGTKPEQDLVLLRGDRIHVP
jgi:polysaccharide export outer membrane protein